MHLKAKGQAFKTKNEQKWKLKRKQKKKNQ